MTTLVPAQDQDLNVQLRDLMQPLGYTNIAHIRARFETFKTKLLKDKDVDFLQPFKSDIYVDYDSGRIVDTYVMTRMCAINFACYVDPAKGMDVMCRLMNAHPEPAPIPYFTAKTCNKRMLAERYNRSISSITTTFERNAKWLVEIGGMEEHMEERDGELWFTEAYASCIAFGGGKVAAQTKAKAMIASYDNQKLSSDTLQKLLK